MFKIFRTIFDILKNENRNDESLLDQPSRLNDSGRSLTYYGQFTTIHNYNLCDLTKDDGLSDIISLNEKIKENLKEYQDRSERFVSVSKSLCRYKINPLLISTWKEIQRISKIYRNCFVDNTLWLEKDVYDQLKFDLEEQRHGIIIKNFKAIKKNIGEYRRVLKELLECYRGLILVFANIQFQNPIFVEFMNDIMTFSCAVIPHGEELKNIKRFLTDFECLELN